MAPLLEVRGLSVSYGADNVVREVSLEVDERSTVTVIGSNGAGKTSVLKAIVGLKRPSSGDIRFEGRAITGWPAHRIAALGIGLVPEGRRLFPQMTVMENLELGAYRRHDTRAIAADLERVFALFPRLRERRGQVAQTLSGGEQQMLAIGRALMAHVRLLLLDEPSLGLAPVVVRQITNAIGEIQRQEGIGVILVEQNARMALSLAQRAYVLETGRIVMEGLASDVAASDVVKKAYLGL
jgi:branched-chain amino acid transport system ATP-binding protein